MPNVALKSDTYLSRAQTSAGAMSIAGVAGVSLQAWLRRESGTLGHVTYAAAMASSQANLTNYLGPFLSFALAGDASAWTPSLVVWNSSASASYPAINGWGTLSTLDWLHWSATLTFNDATEGNKGCLRVWLRYPNGTLIDPDSDGLSNKVVFSGAITSNTDRFLGLGGAFQSAGSTTQTSIADVRFWRKVLTPSEISDNWNRRLNSTEMADSTLGAYFYPTEQAGGDTALEANDTSGPTLTMSGNWTWVAGPSALDEVAGGGIAKVGPLAWANLAKVGPVAKASIGKVAGVSN